MIIVLLGPPGVGKGTQGIALAERLGWRHVATGDLLRSHRRENTELGRQAQTFMDRGELVPDALIMDMVEVVFGGLDQGQGVVFDGFPRTRAQAVGLDVVLERRRMPIHRVVVIEAGDETIVRRMSGRRSCGQCGAVFNVYSQPPREEGVCDRCGGELTQRPDDEAATVRRRLDVYRDLTQPLIEFYRDAGAPLRHVRGDAPVEDVASAMWDAVDGDALSAQGAGAGEEAS